MSLRAASTLASLCITVGGIELGCAGQPSGLRKDRALDRSSRSEPLVIGETFIVRSRILNEPRLVNVFVPTIYGEPIAEPLPVLYMLDGGLNEDFLHIAGLVQVLVCNGGMRPFMLVGVPNTQRRRDLTGPTSNPEDLKIAPVVGGSAVFRRFLREELMPEVRARYRVSDEAAIIGESLAGLFAMETFVLEPDLFNSYIAADPSLWWADGELLRAAGHHLSTSRPDGRTVFVAWSNEPSVAPLASQLASILKDRAGLEFRTVTFPNETHATVFHAAAFAALRSVFAPRSEVGK